ncbi:MAG: radical SAM protein [Candidatus Shapirobacteria bacterium]
MKVVFIQPYYHNIWESLGIAYIIAYCKKNYSGNLKIDFYQGKFDKDKEIIKGAKGADIVAFSCTSPTFEHALKLARELKKKNPRIWTVFGGWHPTALGEKCFTRGVDQIVAGEGEKAFLEILKGNRDKIVYGKPIDFSELPWPDRKVIKNQRTIDLCEDMCGLRIASFQANRVCPFRCAFCSERTMTGRFNPKANPIRTRDVKDLLDEIEVVSNTYRLDLFKFVDATFDTSADFVIRFCKEKIGRGNKMEWECLIHASLATREMFRWLHKANCNQVNVGCESGSLKILNDIGKGLTPQRLLDVFGWAKEFGIKRRAFFILGMPNETKKDIVLTDKLAGKLNPDVFGITLLCPYPGCDLYDHQKMKNFDWSVTDEYSNNFWRTKNFTNRQLRKIQSYFEEKYYPVLCAHQREMVDARRKKASKNKASRSKKVIPG